MKGLIMKDLKSFTLKGFTLIELMIAIAIVGILASIAVPAYNTYTIKARASELLATAGAAQTLVSEAIQAQGWTSDATRQSTPTLFSNLTFPFSQTSNLSNVCIAHSGTNGGVIQITGTSAVKGIVFNFVPNVNNDGSVSWTCNAQNTASVQYLPSICSTVAATTCP